MNILRNPEDSPVHVDSPMRVERHREAATAVRAVTAADILDRVRRAATAAMQAGAGPLQALEAVPVVRLEELGDAAVITDGDPRMGRT